ncbi:DUF432 domain-containing protein [Gaoshiqia sp. Z1-71]|uniref:DUF432 domain-containing protein n=1 Tax=Gaoshiqia hydrogeniformans TaxID=3290090 RepID=UPI003BF90D6C
MQKTKSIWGKYEGKPGRFFKFKGGFTEIQVKRFAGGWMFKENRTETAHDTFSADISEEGEALLEAQIYQTGRSEILFAQPALPKKPVVFRNNKPMIVSPMQSIRLFLSVPVNIQFYFSQPKNENLMCEFSTFRLSDTWFGEPDGGEPAFSIGSRFALQGDQLQKEYYDAVCPVHIQNNSNQALDLQRLIIHVENLNTYQKSNQLVTDLVTIEFKGQDMISSLQFSTEKGLHGESPLLISKARMATSKNILGQSFHFIKNFTQF